MSKWMTDGGTGTTPTKTTAKIIDNAFFILSTEFYCVI